MRTGVIRIQDIVAEGRRLTGGFHVSEDQRAIASVRRLRASKSPLKSLVSGRGIFRGPIFSRMYVDEPSHGEPYVSARDIVTADVRPAAYLSRQHGRLLNDLRLNEGMILVTCSGMNLGSAIWTRQDMHGLVASHDLIRIEPNADAAPPGFLFTFLASRYGNALIRKQIYGGHIKHIEPDQIGDMPIPRLGASLEERVDRLVRRAADLRAEASAEIARAERSTLAAVGLPNLPDSAATRFSARQVSSSRLNLRLDAHYHSEAAHLATEAVAAGKCRIVQLSEAVKRYFKPPMFKRIWVDGPEHGRQFVSGSDAYRHEAEAVRYVSHKTPRFDEFLLEEGSVIFQAAGQIYGIFGRPLFVSGWLTGLFAADDMYRLVPQSKTDGGYLFAFLRTGVGQTLLKRQACGNSIPRVWDPHMRDIYLPWPDDAVRARIGKAIVDAHAKIEQARQAQSEATTILEDAIEKRPN